MSQNTLKVNELNEDAELMRMELKSLTKKPSSKRNPVITT